MDDLIKNLSAALGREQVIFDPEELLVFECDGLTHYAHRPRAVVFPRSTEEVAEAVRVLAGACVPFAPRGAGTGLSGGALALGGGVCIELARMRRVLRIEPENRRVVVETGVVNSQVTRAVAGYGLHYAPDPSSQATCTVGGNIAENAGGIHCLKYGTTTDHVLAARVVLSDGSIVDIGSAEECGYDLLGVFVGSEGTFGIATEATLKLTPVAPSVRTMLADFSEPDDASRAVSAIIAAGIIPAALEMVDGATIRAVEASVFAAGLPLDAEAALLVELDGIEAGLERETEMVRSICLQHGARACRLAVDERERKKLWAARKGAFGALGRLSPDLMLQDAVVPRSSLPEVLSEVRRIGAAHRLLVANVFHAGDGNLHPFICFDARDPDEVSRVHDAGRAIVEACVRAGGTITGEHGVGIDKSDYLPLVFSDDDLDVMLKLRAAFDPFGLCNPGKIIPAPVGCGEARAVARAKAANGNDRRTEDFLVDEAQFSPAATATEIRPNTARQHDLRHTLRNPAPEILSPSSFEPDDALGLLSALVGGEHVSQFEIEGVNGVEGGRILVSPADAEEVSAILRVANERGLTVAPAGGSACGNLRESRHTARIILDTRRLCGLFSHEPADLVATAGAGTKLADFNRELARAGQWLPLDPDNYEETTLGGVAATNACGPQAYGYGAPRSHVLGMSVAMADGRIVRAGGRVVKNVAGYDLCKLFVGSRGTLCVMLDLTLKLRPRPQSEATVMAASVDVESLWRAGCSVADARLLPVAIEMTSPDLASSAGAGGGRTNLLLVRFAGTEEAVSYQTQAAARLIEEHVRPARVAILSDDAETWDGLSNVAGKDRASDSSLLSWRAVALPGEALGLLLKVASEIRDVPGSHWRLDAGSGRLRVSQKISGRDEGLLKSLGSWRRQAENSGGALVIETAPAWLTNDFDSLNLPSSVRWLVRKVKTQLDPAGILSPGVFDLDEERRADGRK